jgi:hypothetical protein
VATPPTANEIKAQLKTLLSPVIGTTQTRKVKILDYMALAFKPEEQEDPAVLRSSLDLATTAGRTTIQRINCLMLSEEGFSQTKTPTREDFTRLIKTPRGRNIITRRIRLTYFYQFGESSEPRFSDNVELIRTTINSYPKLGFDTGGAMAGKGEYVEGHDLLQMPLMLPDAFGDVMVHVAEGTLTVRVIEPLES